MDSVVPNDGPAAGVGKPVQTAVLPRVPLHPYLIADDLTGALDTAAQFAFGTPIPVHWRSASDMATMAGTDMAGMALDSGTRERSPDEAHRRVAELAAKLPRHRGALYYAKLDSLLRGNTGAEIAAWMSVMAPAHCIVAPAFPYQGRITRGGVQLARQKDGPGWSPAAGDLQTELTRQGLRVRFCSPGDPVPFGISVWDAETDADLDAIAAGGLALDGSVLWCGSSGLAGALARQAGVRDSAPIRLPGPVLGLFGTNHPAMVAQLTACAEHVLTLPDGGPTSAAALSRRLDERGIVLGTLALPDGLSRAEAACRIEREFAQLVRRLDPPGTLVVAGGETLRCLCLALEADRLDLDGQIWPGVPRSILRGGRFDGVRVISKSGAFGGPALLRRLLAPAAPLHQGEQA